MPFVRAFVALAVLLAVAVLISCGSSAGGNSVIPTYSMGERAQAGPLIYTVFENRWSPQLGAGPSPRIPSNRFLLLRLSIVNGGGNEMLVPALHLIDDSGQRFLELSDGEEIPQWIGYVRRIKPADTVTGNIAFDVPARHYKLEVIDESEEKKAIVDIPLSFNLDQAPMVDLPGASQVAPQPKAVTPR